MSNDRIPSGFWKLDAYTNGYQIVVLGDPPHEEEMVHQLYHNCDQMGCGSLDHVVAVVPIMTPTPELRWSGSGRELAIEAGLVELDNN